ncbi:MAG: HEAT repeat domain-containing protein [Anaerolineae bacterium]
MEQKDKKRKKAEEMWQALEEKAKMPKRQHLPNLSGLMDEDLERFIEVWATLPVEERRQLMETLVEMAEKDFALDFGAILRLGLSDPDASVRARAIDGLWEDEDVRLVPRLASFLREGEAEEVRVAAAKCLAHFVLLGELQKIRPDPFETAYTVLLDTYRDPEASVEVRRRALESLAYAGHSEVTPAIEEAYAHPEETMRVSSIFAMGRSADRRWIETVIEQLHHPSPQMRYEAARAAGELSARKAVRDLVDLAEDVDIEVQQAALWALGQIGGEQARRTLNHYLQSENEALRDAAQEALNELEFLHGDLSRFYGPPEDFVGEGEIPWYEDKGDKWEE